MSYKKLAIALLVLFCISIGIWGFSEYFYQKIKCLNPPENAEVFCLISEPQIIDQGNYYSVTLDLWRKENGPSPDRLMVFTLLYDFEVEPSILEEYPGYIAMGDVSGLNELRVTVNGRNLRVTQRKKELEDRWGVTGKYVGLGQEICKGEDCKIYGVYEWKL